MTGKKKRLLRAMALRQKTDGIMPSVEWPLQKGNLSHDSTDIDSLNEISIDNRFIERVDQLLFDHEVVLLRLTNVVKKKKGAKIIGDRVAQITNAYVAQVLGHTALLYRPATPPIIDLDDLLQKDLDE
jgi:RNA-binding protein YhbY